MAHWACQTIDCVIPHPGCGREFTQPSLSLFNSLVFITLSWKCPSTPSSCKVHKWKSTTKLCQEMNEGQKRESLPCHEV